MVYEIFFRTVFHSIRANIHLAKNSNISQILNGMDFMRVHKFKSKFLMNPKYLGKFEVFNESVNLQQYLQRYSTH